MMLSQKRELGFEREKWCRLIDSKMKRREVLAARTLAEEFFRTEVQEALIAEKNRLHLYSTHLVRTILLLTGAFLASEVFVVLNFNPSLNLLTGGIAISGILFAMMVKVLILRRFARVLEKVATAYDKAKEPFVKDVLSGFDECTTRAAGEGHALIL